LLRSTDRLPGNTCGRFSRPGHLSIIKQKQRLTFEQAALTREHILVNLISDQLSL
jgi:hypothetical protein